MPEGRLHLLVAAIEAGEQVAHDSLASLAASDRSAVEEALLASPAGRRWLRASPDLDDRLADRLLAFEADFQQPRRDRTLIAVVERVSPDAIAAHAPAIASGPAAPALWERTSLDHDNLTNLATSLVGSADPSAAEATLHLLVLDPLDQYRVGLETRLAIAEEALRSTFANVRGLAAEYLAAHDPATLARELDSLMTDENQRVRGIAWDAALRVDPSNTLERATALMGDEAVPIELRRSALVAIGTVLPTGQVADLLAFFVVHPDHELAADAARLLYQLHRNPITAEAARESPHADVREIAERLLDPTLGSPAAGGSRPGDPTRSSADIYADLIKQLEEQPENQSDASKR